MIELKCVTKFYPTPHGRHYVFRDLSFRFPEGASIAVLGPNGAGKSTMLRMLGGIEAPNRGYIQSDERISWPVGLSGGFQGSLTGRDNVRFVCRMFGLTGSQMRERVAYVEDFAEIGRAFDRPIKGYSSGMRSRLAFGLSMAFDFDYYLIDEVMAVGDPAFQRKSQEVFRQRLGRSKVILVSHNVEDVRALCDVVVLVSHGEATLYSDIEEGIAVYEGRPYVGPATCSTEGDKCAERIAA
ncbi:MAG TPA: ABC transporter ATP-binding protein [Burkholderiaceae bacterium]|nr:ABC transporter ATP-binding protein [Burkholderiaceae bacterium]